VESAELADFDSQYRCNARAPYRLTQLLLPMLKQSAGQVVFINSTAGLLARANAVAYAAAKHALKAVADGLREEVNANGIRVTTVFLGRTATPMQEKIFRAEARAYRGELLLQPEQVAEMVVHILCLPRTAEVTDITIRPALKSY